MTKLEIIDMVASHYNSNNRGTIGKKCVYKTYGGKMCAVGMCMTEGALKLYHNFTGSVFQLSEQVEELDVLLKKEYRGHDKHFWGMLQNFHDDDKSWDDEGMNERGVSNYEQLKERFA